MAIEKQLTIDRIEIVGDHRHIQTKLRVEIVEDGVVIGKLPGIRLAAKAPDEDIEDLKDITVGKTKMPVPSEIKAVLKAVAEQVWTADIKTKYAAARAEKNKQKEVIA